MAKNSLDDFIPRRDQKRIVDAIAAAEQKTSGEIKVHIEPRGPADKTPYERAAEVFLACGLAKTRDQNAVLVYVASADRKFAMIGDTGIHADVGDAFWSTAIATMSSHFKTGAYADGLVDAVRAIGERLATRFPRTAAGKKENQLSDDISTDETLKKS